tara:strand:+ start:247 stop:816 length:570 start_codon:yes stop_codon:yes gene_type:complete
MTSTPASNLVQTPMQQADDEIDLRQVAAALVRQKKLIAAFAGAAVLLSGLYAITRKPVWEGQFQIVLENQDSGSAGRLALQQNKSWPIACELLAQGPLQQAQSVALIPVGQPDSRALQTLTTALQSALSGRSLLVSSDLVKTGGCDSQLLVAQAGNWSRSQLAQLQQSLTLQGTPVAGWLLFDPTKELV